ncbi:cationic peroxidase SPC4-like [Bidens hawaiensis]|uniref:cationic peroxidase SPC4-like n=1 Tax=Bidens hawaiensis TaxID=980011 RepID=UPI00404981A1
MAFPTVEMSVGVLVVMIMHLHGLEAQQQPIVEGLSWNFYESSCPNLESVIRTEMERVITEDVALAAALLRVHFHDCFVQGCDGSVLLDGSASGPVDSGQTAPPNLSLRGFNVIESIRSRVHDECGAGSVSCADITALLARDAVALTGGPEYCVPLGRRDGLTFATINETL